MPSWSGDREHYTWKNWKTTFHNAHIALEHEQCAYGKFGNNFGRSDSGVTITNAYSAQFKIMEQLDDDLSNISIMVNN